MLTGTPYLMTNEATAALLSEVNALEERVQLLRSQGTLSPETLARYYQRTRIEQVAESNALEGSTLSAGETELAVLKGITILGHDPAYAEDARALAKALDLLVQLAKAKKPTDITEVKKLHELVLAGNPSSGSFRSQPVSISGSDHRPPKTITEILDAMEAWENWSKSSVSLASSIRSAVLHAWLVHIHPFINGNGRTARAVNNLELIRGGYPPIIIRKSKDRPRYLDALHAADSADLAPFLELILDRAGDALRDLERTAKDEQGYDVAVARVRKAQENRLRIWATAVELLSRYVFETLERLATQAGGTARLEVFRDSLDVNDYIELCAGRTISKSWMFKIELRVPGLGPVERLAWAGFRSAVVRGEQPSNSDSGPSLFWSKRNDKSYPPWTQVGVEAPGGEELTLAGDQWLVRTGHTVRAMTTTALGDRIARDLMGALA